MPECVVIKFTGDISVCRDDLLAALAANRYNDYDSEDSRCGCSDSPASPGIAQEIKIWSPSTQRLYLSCRQAIWRIEKDLKRPIPFEIEIGK